jgi:dTDP-4-amino-4,6-dideoxygalactose transaminase
MKLFDPVLPDKEEIKAIIDDIWSTGQLTNFGKYNNLFEEKIQELVGCKHAIAVTNCDLALKLCVNNLFGVESKVALPSFTFNSTYMAPAWNSNETYLMDVNKETLLVDLNTIERYHKQYDIRNFILVNTFGNLYDIDELNFLKNKYHLNILFDSAHSFFSTYKNKKSGNLGYTECFSFSATKLITSAEGGVICTDDTNLYQNLKFARNYGFYKDYDSIMIGSNGKLSELNAAIGYASLKYVDSVLIEKLNNVEFLKKHLGNLFEFQKITDGVKSSYKDFILLNLNVDPGYLQKQLEKDDIPSKRYFLPLHHQTAIVDHATDDLTYVNTDTVYDTSLCIPCHAKLTKQELNKIVNNLTILYSKLQ